MNKHKHIEFKGDDAYPYYVVEYCGSSVGYRTIAKFRDEGEANHFLFGFSDNRPYRIVRESDGEVVATFRFASDMKILFNYFYSSIGRMERYLVADMEWIDYK